VSEPRARSLSLSGDQFYTVWPAVEKARRPYLSSQQRGTRSCRFTEWRRSQEATSEAGVRWLAIVRYQGAWPCRLWCTMTVICPQLWCVIVQSLVALCLIIP